MKLAKIFRGKGQSDPQENGVICDLNSPHELQAQNFHKCSLTKFS